MEIPLPCISFHCVSWRALLACAIFWGGIGWQQGWGQEAAGVAYLKTGITARELAMGESGVSFATGAASAYWNPAGLALGQENNIEATYQRWVGEVRLYSALFRIGQGTNGGWGGLAQAVTEIHSEGKRQVALATFGWGYGRRFGQVAVGVLAKALAEQVLTETLYGYALDVGIQVFWRGVQMGAVVQNLGDVQELEAFVAPLPRTLRVGASFYPFRIVTLLDNQPVLQLALTVDYVHRPDGGRPLWSRGIQSWHVGMALETLGMIEWRVGYINGDTLRDLSLGFGVRLEPIRFDYAYIPFKPGFEGTAGHVFSLSTRWP